MRNSLNTVVEKKREKYLVTKGIIIRIRKHPKENNTDFQTQNNLFEL